MTEAELNDRLAVVAEARTWISTPYHHRAKLKGVGVDCAQLPIAVYSALGLIPEVAPDYVQQWHLHRDEERYLQWVEKFAREICRKEPGIDSPWIGEAPQAGDFGVWRFGRTFSHGAIFTGPDEVIHAYIGVGTYADILSRNQDLQSRAVRVFSLWPRES